MSQEAERQPAATPPVSSEGVLVKDGAGAKTFGWLLFVVGLGLIAWAFGMDPSVASPGGGEFGFGDRINNLGLLQQKQMLCTAGAGFLVAGAVFVSGR